MNILHDIPLSRLTTFSVGGNARFVIECTTVDEIRSGLLFAQEKKIPWFVIGGGSNILASDEGFAGVILHIQNKGIDFISDTTDSVIVSVSAGENWDDLVKITTERGLWGIENLSYIPGSVGASPVQNIGAYGVEVKDTIINVSCIDTLQKDYPEITLTNTECQFSYRNSIFKQSPDRYIVTRVDFKLSHVPNIKASYPDVTKLIPNYEISAQDMRSIIGNIRSKKLPSLQHYGTAGSFFKNPIISREQFNVLKNKYPELSGHEYGNNHVKVSCAWIIDHILNMKGYRYKSAQVYEQQALVLVVVKGGENISAQDVEELAQIIEKKTFDVTGIMLEREVCKLPNFSS